jgi:serine protease Do
MSTYRILRAGLLAAVGLILAAGSPPVNAQWFGPPASLKSSPKVLAAFKGVVAKPSASTVRVRSGGKECVLGTIVGTDGWIITKASELKPGQVVCKLKDGRSFDARIIGIHDKCDLALLKVDAKGLKAVEWAKSDSARVGNWVASPGTKAEPVAIGVVSVAARAVKAIAMPAPTPPPNSGFLGIQLGPDGSAKIATVTPKSAAEKAGLKAGDLVLSVAGRAIEDAETLVRTIQRFKAGETVTLKVKRESEEVEIKAKLDKRPSSLGGLNRGDFQNRMGSALSERKGGFPAILTHDQVIKPTDCGGPLVDLDGKAVGINIARAGRTESYALPSEVVQALLPELKSGKLAPPPEPPPAVKAAEKALAAAEAALKAQTEALDAARAEHDAASAKLKTLSAKIAELQKKLEAARKAVEKAKSDKK